MNVSFAAVLAAALFAAACSSKPGSEGAEMLARGRYLVEHVGLCGDCHSPRNPDGSFDRSQWLTGAPIGFTPLAPMPWAGAAPGLAGLVGYTDEQALALLCNGVARTGKPPLPPMPEYRFTEGDARAVIRYLRSLRPKS